MTLLPWLRTTPPATVMVCDFMSTTAVLPVTVCSPELTKTPPLASMRVKPSALVGLRSEKSLIVSALSTVLPRRTTTLPLKTEMRCLPSSEISRTPASTWTGSFDLAWKPLKRSAVAAPAGAGKAGGKRCRHQAGQPGRAHAAESSSLRLRGGRQLCRRHEGDRDAAAEGDVLAAVGDFDAVGAQGALLGAGSRPASTTAGCPWRGRWRPRGWWRRSRSSSGWRCRSSVRACCCCHCRCRFRHRRWRCRHRRGRYGR